MSLNPFAATIVAGLAEQEVGMDRRLQETERGWRHLPVAGRASPPALLSGRALAAEVTDRGALLLPHGSQARPAVDVSTLAFGATPELVLEPNLVQRIEPGSVTRWFVHADLPLLVVRMQQPADEFQLRLPATASVAVTAGGLWCQDCDLPLVRRELTHNNSRVPDPAPPSGPDQHLLVVGLDAHGEIVALRPTGSRANQGLLVDRVADVTEVTVRAGAPVSVALLVVGPTQAVARSRLPEISLAEPPAAALRCHGLGPDLDRQLGFAVANTLGARAGSPHGDIFLHGRRDRGYADVDHLHQSYAMHLPALASGEAASVRSDLLAHLRLQDEDGGLRRSPRPGPGSHPYVGTYTTSHLPLALERYLAWSGDAKILDEVVDGEPVLARLGRAMAWLASTRTPDGLVAPCGWLDAWNPDVVAQGQASVAAVLGWRAMARVLEWAQRPGAAAAATAADDVAAAIRARLLRAGVVAENVLADGSVEGGSPEDFFSHTQLWAALADLTDDERGLDLVAQRCWSSGIGVVPPTALQRSYLADSTDGEERLDLGSTATWLLAAWPELTHLFALVLARRGRSDQALEAVWRALPTTLYRAGRPVLPHFYAEKYLQPGDHPWLCTWAGDPTLWEVVLTGFFGVRPTPGALSITPAWPRALAGCSASIDFVLRGERWHLTADPELGGGVLEVDGEAREPGPIAVAPRAEHLARLGTGFTRRPATG